MDPGGFAASAAGGAFGGGKAGGAQDPLTFLKKIPVVVRLSALVSKATMILRALKSKLLLLLLLVRHMTQAAAADQHPSAFD